MVSRFEPPRRVTMKRARLFLILFSVLAFILPISSSTAEEVIKWGVTAALQFESGFGTKNACLMAVEEINNAGGILGQKVVPYFADDSARPEVGVRAVKKLLYEDKVDFVSGGWLSGVGLAQASHIFAAKKLWFSTGPYTLKLPELVKKDYEQAKYFFRVASLNSHSQALGMIDGAAGFFKGKLGLTKMAFMPESSVWGREMAIIVEEGLKGKGVEIVYKDIFDPKTTDFSPQFAGIKASGAEFLFSIQAVSTGIPMTKQAAETQLPAIVGGYVANSQVFNYWDKTGGKCYLEVNQILNGGRAPITSKTIPFFDKYVDRYGISPTYTASAQYDALYLLKHVAEKTKSLDTDTLIEALEKVNFEGVVGWTRFDKYHESMYGEDAIRDTWIQWHGEQEMTVIYPDKYATGDFQWPPWVKKK